MQISAEMFPTPPPSFPTPQKNDAFDYLSVRSASIHVSLLKLMVYGFVESALLSLLSLNPQNTLTNISFISLTTAVPLPPYLPTFLKKKIKKTLTC